MSRGGAIIFADLIGKLDVTYKSGPSKAWLKIKKLCIEWANYYQNEAAHAPARDAEHKR
jgi:hypothetical protein